ncbi:hypothetical protein CEXT_667881 [Caerostris extrusa]|uniref:Uncharacterized protein n=1 Tax=Caerostris extrusa TaxID=172846 RepID=A0AAV4SF44_CAEEX|nr:hypothetical protein CEXT_667881 [Caerostris extrusa]
MMYPSYWTVCRWIPIPPIHHSNLSICHCECMAREYRMVHQKDGFGRTGFEFRDLVLKDYTIELDFCVVSVIVLFGFCIVSVIILFGFCIVSEVIVGAIMLLEFVLLVRYC